MQLKNLNCIAYCWTFSSARAREHALQKWVHLTTLLLYIHTQTSRNHSESHPASFLLFDRYCSAYTSSWDHKTCFFSRNIIFASKAMSMTALNEDVIGFVCEVLLLYLRASPGAYCILWRYGVRWKKGTTENTYIQLWQNIHTHTAKYTHTHTHQ